MWLPYRCFLAKGASTWQRRVLTAQTISRNVGAMASEIRIPRRGVQRNAGGLPWLLPRSNTILQHSNNGIRPFLTEVTFGLVVCVEGVIAHPPVQSELCLWSEYRNWDLRFRNPSRSVARFQAALAPAGQAWLVAGVAAFHSLPLSEPDLARAPYQLFSLVGREPGKWRHPDADRLWNDTVADPNGVRCHL